MPIEDDIRQLQRDVANLEYEIDRQEDLQDQLLREQENLEQELADDADDMSSELVEKKRARITELERERAQAAKIISAKTNVLNGTRTAIRTYSRRSRGQ